MNDELQRVLRKYDDIVNGANVTPTPGERPAEDYVTPTIGIRPSETSVSNLVNELQHVLRKYDDIAKGTPSLGVRAAETSIAAPVNVGHEDDESEDDFSQLDLR